MLVASHEGGQLIMQDSSLIMTIYITDSRNNEELRDEENKIDIVWKMLFVGQRDKERQSKAPFYIAGGRKGGNMISLLGRLCIHA